jgi:hypothetical protein
MIFKNTLKLTSLLLAVLLVTGCDGLFEDHASKFHLDDINQVEWGRPNPASSSLSYTANLDADQTDTETVPLEVQLIGAQTGSDRSAGVAIVDGDAVEGTQIDILNSNNQVVIPANSNHGTVEIGLNSENIGNGREYFALLELQEGDELEVAVNFKDMAFTIEKDAVSFTTDFEVGVNPEDPSGSSELTGLSLPDELIAEISVENFASNTTFDWQVHYNTCNDGEDVVGNAGDYPAFDTDGDGAASTDVELGERIFQADQYHLRIQDDQGNEVVCSDYEAS